MLGSGLMGVAPASQRERVTGGFRSCLVVAAVVYYVAVLPGCSGHGFPRGICFSPDGQTIAYIWTDVAGFGYPFVFEIELLSNYVRWASAGSPERQHSVRFGGDMEASFAQCGDAGVRLLSFSPDSDHLAVVGGNKILIIHLASGRHWELRTGGRSVETAVWLSNEEMTYAAYAPGKARDPLAYRLGVWRQKVHKSSSRPKKVYGGVASYLAGSFSFSPNGRYLIFLKPVLYGQCMLLDVITGKVHSFGPQNARIEGIAWKQDSSSAFCVVAAVESVSEIRGLVRQRKGLLLDPATVRVVELKEYAELFENSFPRVEPHWTADRQYVAVWFCGAEHKGPGLVLIRPSPWKVASLDGLAPDGMRPWSVGTVPIPGWVWMSGLGRDARAVDYRRGRAFPISQSYEWAISPDGKRVAELDEQGDITIRSFKLPSSLPREPEAMHYWE